MRRLAALAWLLILVVGACAPPDDNANGGLVGTAWTVVSIGGTSTLAASPPTMAFREDGTVAGSDGCNQFNARFRTDRERISIVGLVTTKIGCDRERSAQAQAFASALTGATGWRQTEQGALELTGAGTIVAVPGVASGAGADLSEAYGR